MVPSTSLEPITDIGSSSESVFSLEVGATSLDLEVSSEVVADSPESEFSSEVGASSPDSWFSSESCASCSLQSRIKLHRWCLMNCCSKFFVLPLTLLKIYGASL
ncbi:hypothetical protein ACFX1S_042951 [Malus domestica]